jgi:hypothetical protein
VDPVKKEMILMRAINAEELKSDNQHKITFYTTFDDAVALKKMTAHDALNMLAAKAQAVLDSLKARCRELGAS